MAQNSMRLPWSRQEVDGRLREIMQNIHETCVRFGKGEDGFVDYVKGANIGGFVKVANAMLAQGAV
jgi:glutamate dehydrogenase (NADP+)